MRSSAQPLVDRLTGRRRPKVCAAIGPLSLCLAGLSFLLTPAGLDAAAISGSVAEGEKPIRQVTVTLRATAAGPQTVRLQSTTTDEEGLFRFDGVPPGSYVIAVEKKRWIPAQKQVFLSGEDPQDELQVDFQMRLTPVWRVLGNVQVGLLVYVVLFGLLVLAANMWIVPVPSREVSLIGWAFIVGSVLIACVKLMWVEALVLTALGGVLGCVIHRFGGRAAARRVGLLEQEHEHQAAKEKERQDRLASLVGRQGVAVTDLKACGTASLEGERVEVRALDGFIPKGAPVVVKSLQGKTPVVERRQPVDVEAADPPGLQPQPAPAQAGQGAPQDQSPSPLAGEGRGEGE